MKNMRLSDLMKLRLKDFRKLGKIPYGKSKEEVLYIARKSFEAIPSKYRAFLEEDKERYIMQAYYEYRASSSQEGLNLYEVIKGNAYDKFNEKYTYLARIVWNAFRVQCSNVYNHFNTYMYRLGYSASRYWYENVKWTNQPRGSVVTTELFLPQKLKGMEYDALLIAYDTSSGRAEAYMTPRVKNITFV